MSLNEVKRWIRSIAQGVGGFSALLTIMVITFLPQIAIIWIIVHFVAKFW
jgi:hypothetical protein